MVQHPDPDDLTLLAMGEPIDSPVDTSIDAHLAECEQCRAEVESMRRTVELAELSNFGEGTRQPGEHIWNAIAAELGFGAGRTRNGSAHRPQAAAGTEWDVDRVTAADAPAETTTPPSPTLRAVSGTATPTPAATGPAPDAAAARARRWPRWAAPMAALVIGVALGAGVLVVAQNRSDSVTVEATAPLTSVPTGPLSHVPGQLGRAELVVTNQGQQVRVSASDLPSMPGTSYEVWLFGDDGRMVSLGSLDQGQGQFTVPDDISTQEYRTVDISDELPDGNPAHSGISMVRGSFS